jgi:hypothetical protein
MLAGLAGTLAECWLALVRLLKTRLSRHVPYICVTTMDIPAAKTTHYLANYCTIYVVNCAE